MPKRSSAEVTVPALYGAGPHLRNQALFATAEPRVSFAATGADAMATPPVATPLVNCKDETTPYSSSAACRSLIRRSVTSFRTEHVCVLRTGHPCSVGGLDLGPPVHNSVSPRLR